MEKTVRFVALLQHPNPQNLQIQKQLIYNQSEKDNFGLTIQQAIKNPAGAGLYLITVGLLNVSVPLP